MDRPAIWGLLLGVLTSGVLQVTRERTWVMIMSRNMCQKNMTQLPPRGALFGQHTMSGRLDDFTLSLKIQMSTTWGRRRAETNNLSSFKAQSSVAWFVSLIEKALRKLSTNYSKRAVKTPP